MCNFFMFEGLPETSEEGLTLELSVFESLYGGQFELSTKLIKRKSFCYTLHWSSTIVVLRNLPPFTLTFSSVNKRCLWVTVLSIRFGVRGYLGKAPAGEWLYMFLEGHTTPLEAVWTVINGRQFARICLI